MRTVELLLESRLEQTVRDVWEMLHTAGLKSLATHRHPTNRPHLTLVAGDWTDPLPALDLPIAVELRDVRFLGRALVWAAEPGPALREAQSRVWHAVTAVNPLHAPQSWTPHVSLALNVPDRQRAAALGLLTGLPPRTGELIAARSYETETRTVTDLS